MIKKNFLFSAFIGLTFIISCGEYENSAPYSDEDIVADDNSDNENNSNSNFANIDFSNWKVTLPVDVNNNGSPDEYQPASLVDGKYRINLAIKPYMYDDEIDKSIVFHTFPATSTTNSSYSRTELRELINPSNSRVNWSLETGGTMKGKLKMLEISKDNSSSNREYHNTIFMQIHGIISISDMTKFGFSSNNGPPLIKMRWIDGYVWAYKKSLVNESTSGNDLLDVSNDTWVDEKQNMGFVGFNEFEFRITASKGKLVLQLNTEVPLVYQDISMAKWPFENYFKAGNYLGTTDAGAFAKVKYYELTVEH